MHSNLCPSRFFHTSDGWYVYMRPGDEQHCTYCGLRKVKFAEIGGRLIAGPFRRERTMRRWFDNFVWTHGAKAKRGMVKTYIPNDIVFPEWTPFDGDIFHYNPPDQPVMIG